MLFLSVVIGGDSGDDDCHRGDGDCHCNGGNVVVVRVMVVMRLLMQVGMQVKKQR